MWEVMVSPIVVQPMDPDADVYEELVRRPPLSNYCREPRVYFSRRYLYYHRPHHRCYYSHCCCYYYYYYYFLTMRKAFHA